MSGKWISDNLFRDYKDVKPFAWENMTFIVNCAWPNVICEWVHKTAEDRTVKYLSHFPLPNVWKTDPFCKRKTKIIIKIICDQNAVNYMCFLKHIRQRQWERERERWKRPDYTESGVWGPYTLVTHTSTASVLERADRLSTAESCRIYCV